MRRRLVVSYLLLTVLVLVVLEVPLALFYSERERDRTTADLAHDANVIATIYEDGLEHAPGVTPSAAPAQEYERRTGARVVVVDTRGVAIVDTAGTVPRDFSTRPEIAAALAGERAQGTRTSDTLGRDLLYVAVPVASGGTVHGAVRLTMDVSALDARIHRFWWGLGAIAAIVLGLVGLLGWALARSLTRPIHELARTANRFGRGDLTPGAPLAGAPAELRRLDDDLRVMAGRLDELLTSQRAFVADASHELRAPLTALRLRLENVQMGLDDERVAELDAVIAETDRLTGLINTLLRLARADADRRTGEFDLATLANERADTWSAVALEREVTVRRTGRTEPTPVHAVPGAIEQILDNLLDNALRVAPPGSHVDVDVEASAPATATLTVRDQGPGLDDDAKRRATQRFWRSTETGPGSGLGLAIVDQLTRASGGSLTLADNGARGLAVTVRLPRVADQSTPSVTPSATSRRAPR